MTEAAAVRASVRAARGEFALDVQVAVPGQGITGIVGPSGSGKTTLLRCIAGLERDCTGTVSVNGSVWQDAQHFLAPHQRAVGFVFQDARLFPHLDVRRNLEYGAKRSGRGTITFDEVVELLGLGTLLARKPAGLSAGEAQRVAIGRALLRAPGVVLMDEPLANLDVERKQEILPFLERLHGRVTMPILYVSHSLDEVSRLSDHLVILREGRACAAGAINDVLTQADLLTTFAEEAGVILEGSVASIDSAHEVTAFETAAGPLLVPGRHGAPGQRLRLRIQARDVSVALSPPERSTILNVLPAVVESVHRRPGGYVDLLLRAGEVSLLSRISLRSCETLELRPGTACFAQVKGAAVKGKK